MPRGVKAGLSTAKFDRCVKKIKSKGSSVNAYAVCNASLQHKIKRRKGASSLMLKGGASIYGSNQVSTQLVRDRTDSIENGEAGDVSVPVGFVEDVGSFVISAMRVFEQTEGVPPQLVQQGQVALKRLKQVAGDIEGEQSVEAQGQP